MPLIAGSRCAEPTRLGLTAFAPVNTPKRIMNEGTKRSITRWIHVVFSIPIVGYVYSPFADLPDYAPVVRFVSIPVLVLTGLWMWKGHLLRRLFGKTPA